MAKKDKKSKTAEQKARVAAKQSKKATQKTKKAKLKGTTGSDAEDVDLDSVLEEYVRKVGLTSSWAISLNPFLHRNRDRVVWSYLLLYILLDFHFQATICHRGSSPSAISSIFLI